MHECRGWLYIRFTLAVNYFLGIVSRQLSPDSRLAWSFCRPCLYCAFMRLCTSGSLEQLHVRTPYYGSHHTICLLLCSSSDHCRLHANMSSFWWIHCYVARVLTICAAAGLSAASITLEYLDRFPRFGFVMSLMGMILVSS